MPSHLRDRRSTIEHNDGLRDNDRASLGLNAPSKVLTVHGVEGCTEAAQWRRRWGWG